MFRLDLCGAWGPNQPQGMVDLAGLPNENLTFHRLRFVVGSGCAKQHRTVGVRATTNWILLCEDGVRASMLVGLTKVTFGDAIWQSREPAEFQCFGIRS